MADKQPQELKHLLVRLRIEDYEELRKISFDLRKPMSQIVREEMEDYVKLARKEQG